MEPRWARTRKRRRTTKEQQSAGTTEQVSDESLSERRPSKALAWPGSKPSCPVFWFSPAAPAQVHDVLNALVNLVLTNRELERSVASGQMQSPKKVDAFGTEDEQSFPVELESQINAATMCRTSAEQAPTQSAEETRSNPADIATIDAELLKTAHGQVEANSPTAIVSETKAEHTAKANVLLNVECNSAIIPDSNEQYAETVHDTPTAECSDAVAPAAKAEHGDAVGMLRETEFNTAIEAAVASERVGAERDTAVVPTAKVDRVEIVQRKRPLDSEGSVGFVPAIQAESLKTADVPLVAECSAPVASEAKAEYHDLAECTTPGASGTNAEYHAHRSWDRRNEEERESVYSASSFCGSQYHQHGTRDCRNEIGINHSIIGAVKAEKSVNSSRHHHTPWNCRNDAGVSTANMPAVNAQSSGNKRIRASRDHRHQTSKDCRNEAGKSNQLVTATSADSLLARNQPSWDQHDQLSRSHRNEVNTIAIKPAVTAEYLPDQSRPSGRYQTQSSRTHRNQAPSEQRNEACNDHPNVRVESPDDGSTRVYVNVDLLPRSHSIVHVNLSPPRVEVMYRNMPL